MGISFFVERLSPSWSGVRSVIIEFADNYGYEDNMGIRQIEFIHNDEVVSVTSGNSAQYQSTIRHTNFYARFAFRTPADKVGYSTEESWQSDLTPPAITDQWIISTFEVADFPDGLEFEGITINNSHYSGGQTTRGVKNIKIYTSTDEITSHTYGDPIPNSTLIFDDVIAEHVAADQADDQILDLIY